MFRCSNCLSTDSQVIDGRYHKKSNSYIRVRVCKNCGYRMFTSEREIKYAKGLNKISDCYRDKNKEEKNKRER